MSSSSDMDMPHMDLSRQPPVCSPGRPPADTTRTLTCMTRDELLDIARRINARGERHVEIHDDIGERELLKGIQHAMHPRCGADQLCWAETLRSNATHAFRPRMPRTWLLDRYEWLSNWDIIETLTQYGRAYPFYYLIGVFSADFASLITGDKCMEEAACSAPLSKPGLYGMVVNTDTSRGPGIHWVSLLVGSDPEKSAWYGFTYYDSVGNPMIPGVARYIEEARRRNPWMADAPLRVLMDRRRGRAHQKRDTECGMFCLIHHHHAIECYGDADGTTAPEDFSTLDLDDEWANMARRVFFSLPTAHDGGDAPDAGHKS